MQFELDSSSYEYLMHILNEKYYQTTDMEELRKINQLFRMLGYKTDSWLL